MTAVAGRRTRTGARSKGSPWPAAGRALEGAILLCLPAALLLLGEPPSSGPLRTAITLGGIAAIAGAPGVALLRAIGPVDRTARLAASSWALVVPLSLAIDVLLGTALALGPGLTRSHLWISMMVFIAGAIALRQGVAPRGERA